MSRTATLRALFRLASVPRRRLAWAVAARCSDRAVRRRIDGDVAGYLISRAAERPPILSLMVTIVAVRFFGLGRPVVRYLERLASHDMALRVLGRRARRGSSRGSSRSRRPSSTHTARGICSRGWSPTSTRSRTCTSVALSRRWSRCSRAPCRSAWPPRCFPPPDSCSRSVCSSEASPYPRSPDRWARRAGRRQAAARGQLSAELVELAARRRRSSSRSAPRTRRCGRVACRRPRRWSGSLAATRGRRRGRRPRAAS